MSREDARSVRCKLRMTAPPESDLRHAEYESDPSGYQERYGCPCVSPGDCVFRDGLKRYIVTANVQLASGIQVWEVMAESPEDARRRWEDGEAVLLHEEIEVEDCDFSSAEEAGEAE